MKKKYLSFTVVSFFALLGLLSSCGDAVSTPVETTSAVETELVTETETSESRLQSNIPDDLDLGGETINIWYFTESADSAESYYDLNGDASGDVVEDALYQRNLAIEEQLNVDLIYTDTGAVSNGIGSAIKKIVAAGDTDYDMFNVVQYSTAALTAEKYFLNLSDAPYLDFSSPWWSADYINAFTVGTDNVYLLAGDISIDMIRCIGAMYFNKRIFSNLFDSSDALYQTVLDGKWTIDLLQDYILEAYSDLNGDGTVDASDQLGMKLNNYNNIEEFAFAAGAQLSSRDSDNMPVLTVKNEHNIEIYDKMYTLIFETEGTMLDGATADNIAAFNNGTVLFLPGFFYTSESLRNMTDDYGIIPYPKYDEAQDSYISCCQDIATLIALPVTCQKVDSVCAVLEAMAYYSYYELTPVYYETALKAKYTRDDVSSQIIDILHDASMTDFVYAYYKTFGDCGRLYRNLVQSKSKDFASYYAKRENGVIKALDKFIAKYTESDES